VIVNYTYRRSINLFMETKRDDRGKADKYKVESTKVLTSTYTKSESILVMQKG